MIGTKLHLKSTLQTMESLTFVVISIVTIIVFCVWLKKSKKIQKGEPPSVSLYDFKHIMGVMNHQTRHNKLEELSRTYGGMFAIDLFGIKLIALNDWKSMKEALVKQAEAFSAKPKHYIIETIIQQTDIVTSDGPVWKEKRRFTVQQLRTLGFGKSSMETNILNEISRFITKLHKDNGKEIEINGMMQMPILNILWVLVSGKSFKYEDEEMKKLLKMIQTSFEYLIKTTPLNTFNFLRHLPFDLFAVNKLTRLYDEKQKFYLSEIEEHSRTFREGELRDFIDSYLSKIFEHEREENINFGKPTCFQKKHLVGVLENLFSGGVESTATTMEWGFLYLALWPDIQEKIQHELDTVIGRHRQPCLSDRLSLPYTDATIMEIQRYCSVIAISYHSSIADTKVLGYNIPKRALVMRNIWAVHNDKSIWGDPEVFRPERFINSEGKVERSEYLIPFSTGARNCIGEPVAKMELFLFFACLYQHFTLRLVSGKPLPSLEPVVTLIQSPKPFSLVLNSR